jgi:nitroimidazol reductase NimA-like FMN-containing flavoprotein (pyridoxamine 5'-phosphate oxidase superfamily)
VAWVEQSLNYWLATTRPDKRPHVTPVWGAWVGGALYFDGIPTARWVRNIASDPAAAIHLESGTEVVILEGVVEDVATDADVAARIVAAWTVKYGRLLPEPATSGIFRLRPRTARAWSQFPDDATRYRFPDV